MTDLVTLRACFLCHRDAPIKYGTYVRVSWPDGSVKDICDDCWEKGNEGLAFLDECLDMEGDDYD